MISSRLLTRRGDHESSKFSHIHGYPPYGRRATAHAVPLGRADMLFIDALFYFVRSQSLSVLDGPVNQRH
jgi:hypothetical protein